MYDKQGRRWSWLLAVLVAASLMVAACGGSSGDDNGGEGEGSEGTAPAEPEPGGTLAFGLAEESSGWSPAANLWEISGYVVAQAIFDRLMAYDDEDRVLPYLAESMTANDDFTEWTVGLREGVEFHDGTPLDAEALKGHFESMRTSAIWGDAFKPVTGVEVTDPRTVVVTMSQPYSTFPHLLTAEPGYVAAPAQIANPDGSSHPVGTGPFVFSEWEIGKSLKVERNDSYWRDGFPLLDAIDFQVMTDSQTRKDALENGDIDMAEVRDAAQIAEFQEGEDFDVYLDAQGETTEQVLLLNSGAPPFDDPLAREVIAAATNRSAISDALYAGRFSAANGPFKKSSPWFREVEFPQRNPDKAQDLADEYEAANGAPLSFTFQILPDQLDLELGQELQKQYEELGIQMELETKDATTQLVDAVTGNYQMQASRILFGSQNPDREYSLLHSSNSAPPPEISVNITRTVDADIDEALDEARTTDDQVEQADAWKQVQEGLAETHTFIFLVHNDIGVVASTRVEDVGVWTFPDGTPGRPQEQTLISLYQIWLDQ